MNAHLPPELLVDRQASAAMASDPAVAQTVADFIAATTPYKYTYHFDWLGRPIIQFPQDMVAVQELVWTVRPDLAPHSVLRRVPQEAPLRSQSRSPASP
jgi:cephalosporin hydroxylase